VTDLLQCADHALQRSGRVEVVGLAGEGAPPGQCAPPGAVLDALSDVDEFLNRTRAGTRRRA
jgi:hypothetical protein